MRVHDRTDWRRIVYAAATSQKYRYIGTQNVDLEPFGKPPDLHPNIDRLEEEEDRNS